MEYVGSDGSKDCIFCEPEPAIPDRQRLILMRERRVLVLLNRYPYAPGHLMVTPEEHVGRLEELSAETLGELMLRIAEASRILTAFYRCDGLNVGANLGVAAGAGIADHLHFHVVPRWDGDTNFMTVIGETRVISQHLEKSYDELASRFAELGAA